MIYRQKTADLNFDIIRGICSHGLVINSGERQEAKKNIVIRSLDDDDMLVNRLICFAEKIKVIDLIRYIKCETECYKDCFRVYAKIHFEEVLVDDYCDKREYGFIKCVLESTNNEKLFKEIPILLCDTFQTLTVKFGYAFIQLKEMVAIKKHNLGKKQWKNEIVVFSQQATGYFVHEVIGHLLEEDIFEYSQVYMRDIEVPKLTVIDSVSGYEDLVGINMIDDSGVLVQPVKLIEKGKIVNKLSVLHNEYGSGRRSDYKHKLLPRMRCTYAVPYSDKSKEDFYSEFGQCIYVDNIISGGVLYPTGKFAIAGNGYYIVKGERRAYIGNLIIESLVQNYLYNIIDIGKDFQVSATECSKMGEVVRVGIGGPTMCFENVDVSGDYYEGKD